MSKIITRFVLVIAAMLGLTAVVHAADTLVEKKFTLPQHGTFNVKAPTNWSDQIRQPPNNLPPTIRFGARDGAAPFEVLITPIWRMRADIKLPTKEELRQRVEKAIDPVRGDAVEKNINVVELPGVSGPGYYFAITDKAPKPGEFKYMSQGMILVGELVTTFTILTNDGQTQITQSALSMLKGAENVVK